MEGVRHANSFMIMQEYWVDNYCKVESQRLNWMRHNQPKLRADKYKVVQEAAQRGQTTADIGKPVVLPSSFQGGPRHMQEQYQVVVKPLLPSHPPAARLI